MKRFERAYFRPFPVSVFGLHSTHLKLHPPPYQNFVDPLLKTAATAMDTTKF